MVYSKPQRSVLYSLLIYSIFFFFENRGVYAQSEYANDKSVAEMEGEIENLIKENDFANAAKASLDLGLLYYNDANYSSAEKILKKGISYSQKAGDQDQFMTINYNLGILYTRINQYNEALDYFRASLKLAESMKHEKVIIDNNLNIGSIYLKTKKYNRAVKFTEDALKVSLDIFHEEKELECYELFVKIFKKSGDSSNLIEYKKRYDRLRRELDDNKKISDQLLSLEEKIENIEEENDEVYSELKEKSEFLKRAEDSIVHLEKVNEEKQMELNLNQMTIQAQEASIRSAKILRNSILIGIVLLIIIAVVLWKSYKSKKADSEKINKQNQDIKSSITYAQRIQEAMLSREKEHAELFEDSFIYFKPRDIVSGDFYWCEELNNDTPYNDIAITAVDCTGHGVPGAFMSMIGLNALD
ncbi:MAG: tetratricopeptide repeat protein, partial [Cyclobacteriaceae bacterium]|nr:tetratricopeptide repeat protein [Cyclobacteriaceae bacterium]